MNDRIDKNYNKYFAIIKDIHELDYSSVINSYLREKTYDTDCICLFDGRLNEYLGTINFWSLLDVTTTTELEFKIKNRDYHLLLDDESLNTVRDAIKIKNYGKIAVYAKNFPERDFERLKSNIFNVTEWMKSLNIRYNKIAFPRCNENNSHSDVKLSVDMKCFYNESIKWYTRDILHHISSYSYDVLKNRFINEKTQKPVSSDKRRIFLVGPCVINSNVLPDDSLSHILQQRIDDATIIPISVFRSNPDELLRIKEYEITNSDQVLLLEEMDMLGNLDENDIDLTDLFMNQGDEYLCADSPLHVTEFGVKAIADRIIPLIDTEVVEKVGIINKPYKGLLSNAKKDQLTSFVEYIHSMIPNSAKNIGSIVMNANPFTNGHRYLVECALDLCDYLIIFVVEEDSSLVPFDDRISLVKKGLSGIDRVLIVPSGRFVISRDTFESYFSKEQKVDEVIDASFDLKIFSEYIAPGLGIKKRFVGSEPLDNVTNQYNSQMKAILSEGVCEVIEIERLKNRNNYVNATKVRNEVLTDNLEGIKRYVPVSTFEYLKNNKDFLKRRYDCKELLINNSLKISNLNEVYRFISAVSGFYMVGDVVGINLLVEELRDKQFKKLVCALNDKGIVPDNDMKTRYCISDTNESYSWYCYLREKKKIDMDMICLVRFESIKKDNE